ncbi:FAD-dependent oxidoreductase [Mycolicibacterium sp. XJ662]
MATQKAPYLVVGGGLAAGSAVELLAKKNRGGVALVSAEHHVPYARPPLSKAVLSGAAEPSSVFFKDNDFYRERGIQLVLGDAACGLDVDERVVTLLSGRQMAYENLLIATGVTAARLSIPGASLPGVHTLRNLEDAVRLRDDIGPGRVVVVVGGGFIGCEVAATATARGARVHVVERDGALMQRALGHQIGTILADYHRRAGVQIHLGVTIEKIHGEQRAAAVCLNTGAVVACDVVVVGVGSRTATSWVAAAGIEMSEGGIIIDEHCRTSDRHVYAAGDVAAMASLTSKRHVRIEHESNAQQQGAVAARNMLGQPTTYKSLPFVWSHQFGLDIWCLGETSAHNAVEIAGDVSNHRFVAVYRNANRITGVFGVNCGVPGQVRHLMRAGKSFSANELWSAAAQTG